MKNLRTLAFGVLLGLGFTAFAQGTVFPDVQLDDWFAEYVLEIKDWGVVSGNDDGTFAPARNINRAEFSKMLVLYDERVNEKVTAATTALEQKMTREPVITQNISDLPSVMHLEIKNTNAQPAACPEGWEDLGSVRVWNYNDDNYRRTCITDQQCEVLHIDARNQPTACPEGWTEASYGDLTSKNERRTCYICE